MSLPAISAASHATLPALTDAQAHEIEIATRRAAADLLTTDSLSANTARAYASALRYWDAWHVAAFGTPLPLLGEPRKAVDAGVVCAFIAHHSPEESDGAVTLAMPATVAKRLGQLHAVGNRQVAGRGEHIAADVPSLATVKHRIAALSACHTLAGMEAAWKDDTGVRRLLRALGRRAARSAPATLRKPKADISRDLLAAMLRECQRDGMRGLRDAALLHVAFHSGGRRRSELVQMHWSDLSPITLPEPVDGVCDGYLWALREMKGKRRERADGGVMDVPILGAAADALDRWRDVVLATGADAHGPAWWRVVGGGKTPQRLSTPMIGADVWRIVRQRAAQVGMNPADFGAHSLRSGATTTFLREGGALGDASAMLNHAKLDTTRRYYDHRGVPLAAVARLVGRTK